MMMMILLMIMTHPLFQFKKINNNNNNVSQTFDAQFLNVTTSLLTLTSTKLR